MIPDYCEAITAYRAWDVHENGLLVGQAHGEPWPPYQAFVARCGHASQHHVIKGQWIAPPAWGCECGIYALRTYEAAEARARPSNGFVLTFGFRPLTGAESRQVWGSVKLWGRVIEHAGGFRAEFAYPSELWCEDAQLARAVSALYGIPCSVKTFPKPVSIEDEAIWDIFQIPSYFRTPPSGILSWNDLPRALSSPSTTPTPTPAPVPAKLLSRWQQREANKPALPEKDWRAMMQAAFKIAHPRQTHGTIVPIYYWTIGA